MSFELSQIMSLKTLFQVIFIRLFLVAALLWLGGLLWFLSSIRAEPTTTTQVTDAAVVFTGSPGRIMEGIRLLESGLVRKMLVTGVNQTTVSKTQSWLREKTDKYACCIKLEMRAANTAQNAQETVRWVQQEQISSIRLVTATYHLRRSLVELQRQATPNLVIVPHPVKDARHPSDQLLVGSSSLIFLVMEYSKYLMSLARLRWNF